MKGDIDMGLKLLWTDLTITIALDTLIPDAKIVGSIIMALGCILLWLDR